MATEQISTSLPVRAAKQTITHPLAQLTADEITNAVALTKAQWPTNADLHFKAVTLQEPAKAEAAPYLEAEFAGYELPIIDRRAFVSYYIRKTVCLICTAVLADLETDCFIRASCTKPSST